MNHWYLQMADYEYTAQVAQDRAAHERARRQPRERNRRRGLHMVVASFLGLW